MEVDDIIVVQPGERIPLDGVVVEGESMIDTSALTGESVRAVRQPGMKSSADVSMAAGFCGCA